jgi:hypothetical protein
MMALLQELCLLKKQRAESEANPEQSNRENQISLQQRQDEISQEIKTLGGQHSLAEEPA